MEEQGITTKATISTSRRIRFTLVSMRADEAISRPYRYELEVTGSAGLDIDRMLQMGVSIGIDQAGRTTRYFHGVVEQVIALPVHGKTGRYRLTLAPSLAQLARCGRHRVVGQVRAPELVGQILGEHGIAYEFRLARDYAAAELMIQYNESDLAFLSRLMAHEGIFYFFEHAADGHTLVMMDRPVGFSPLPGYATQVLLSGSGEGILQLDPKAAARVERIELDDVDPTRPALDLASGAGAVRRGDSCTTRQEYPGGYTELLQGAARAATRLGAERVGYLSARGRAASRGIAVGHSFTLQGHPHFQPGAEMVAVRSQTNIQAGPVTAAGPRLVSARIACDFTAVEVGQPLALPDVTARPLLRGPHTAVVDGPDGETIHVDAYGRVQVRFPWQERSAPAVWVRVSQNWAGAGRGMLSIPHVGDEVLVEFEHGDPGRPILVGAMYNGAAMPPVALPENKAQTLLQTRSATSAVSNGIRFDDTDGASLLAVDAGMNYQLSVANDAAVSIGGDSVTAIGNDRSLSIGGDDLHIAEGTATQLVSSSASVTVGKNYALTADKAVTVTSGDVLTVSAGKKVTITSQKNILIGNDKASIELKSDGRIVIRGERIDVRAKGKLTLKGADVVEQEGT